MSHKIKKEDSIILLIGKTFGHLGQSTLLEEVHSMSEGEPPEVNLVNEKNNGENVLALINKDLIESVHDVSAGGLLVALSEMCIGSNFGIKIIKPKKLTNLIEYFFGEDQSRYVLEVSKNQLAKVQKILEANNVFYENIGSTQKDFLEIIGEMKINIKDLYKINNQWYNNY